jgi:hypothetical protein
MPGSRGVDFIAADFISEGVFPFSKFDGVVKSRKSLTIVIPAKAGIQ